MTIDPGLIGADLLPLVFTKIEKLKELFNKEKRAKTPMTQLVGSLDKELALKIFQVGGDNVVRGIKKLFQSKTEFKKEILDVLAEE